MTELMDKLFIRLGMEKTEVEATSIRGWLYIGMVYATGLTTAFLMMTAIG